MCLAVPGRIVEWRDRTEPFGTAMVQFDGVRVEVAMGCVSDVDVGDYVIVHAGVAISRLSASDAEQLLDDLKNMSAWDSNGGDNA